MATKAPVPAIDHMNYLFTPDRAKEDWESDCDEFKTMARSIFHREPAPRPGWTPDEYVKLMDEHNVDKVFIASVKMMSWRNKKLMPGWNITAGRTYEAIKGHPNRFVGLVGYNPLRIRESLQEMRHAIQDLGFKGVYVHTYGYGFAPNHRSMYPCYALADELGVPVSMQVGHSLERMPSEVGRPMYMDDIALEFPTLNIIGSHTGWPWCQELEALAWKHDNVFFGVDAHLPRYWEPNVKHFINSRGQDKVIWGTNGMEWETHFAQLAELGLRESAVKKLIRDNAVRLYKLDK